MWRGKTGNKLQISKGAIMSCRIQPPETHKTAAARGKERLRRILISESAHLIWKLRNDRVINERPSYTRREIENRWKYVINRRLELDCLLANKEKFGKKAISKSLVLNTWRDTLPDEHEDDWMKETGVLVGSGT
ncbi:hypothetical protein CPB85DRAFT_1236647 [Mucidula mucida]|nr:hypothetical protein CPB85DRAFT_1236647 [Mucidula mucida]